jgi:hypothetical protein
MEPMYYICKLFDSWSIYDGNKKTSRSLTKDELQCLKLLFPALTVDTGTLVAIQVCAVKAQKLMQLNVSDSDPAIHSKTG